MLVISCALFGWGRLVRRFSGWPMGTWPVTATLGLAAWIFFGGILNLLHLAYPWALDLLVISGLGLALSEWKAADWPSVRKYYWPTAVKERGQVIVLAILLLALMCFTIETQLRPLGYNTGDDFRKYFAHVVRMVQTGTLRGSPLNSIGSETLGGQAFLQGFVAGHFPIQLINGVDAVFCFFLCLTMAGGIFFQQKVSVGAAIISLLAVFFINPQYVNVSALYSMAALLMALIFLKIDPREQASEFPAAPWHEIPLALIYAGVLALKPTVLPFLALQFIFSFLAAVKKTPDWPALVKATIRTILWAALFIAPWLLLSAPEYWSGLIHPAGAPATPIQKSYETINLLSGAEKYFGGSYLAYTAAAFGLVLYAVFGIATGRRSLEPARRSLALNLAAICTAGGAAYLVINVGGVYFMDSDNVLRYSVPILIGVTPAAIGLGSLCWTDRTRVAGASQGTLLALVFGAVLFGLFFQTTINRVKLLLREGTELAFLQNSSPGNLIYFHDFQKPAQQEAAAKEMQRWQQKIPPGKKVIAWVDTPFQLDYKRNIIYDVNEAGLGTAWAVRPETDYVLWQYKGGTITKPADYHVTIQQFGRHLGFTMARTLDFYLALEKLRAQSEIIADEDDFVLMRLKP